MNSVIVGVNWGDEGKGRMVDLLTEEYDIVVRFQGGGNAGHTVINDQGKFALHLLPSGIFRKNVINVLGNGVALDPESLLKEVNELKEKGIEVGPHNLKISERASLLFPWHKRLDELEEERLKDKKYGSTKQGISPFYSDKYSKKTIMAGELLYGDINKKIEDLLEFKNLFIEGVYKKPSYDIKEIKEWVSNYCEWLKPYLINTTTFFKEAGKNNKKILFEAQLGSLRDLDLGIYPFTTSSNTLASYAPIGSGAPFIKIDNVIGVAKAYSTCVGNGPFVVEMFGKEADELREAGGEYGAKTGRARRVGPIDLVATRYGVMVQGCNEVVLTKLDILEYMDEIPVCTKYELDGKFIDEFPFPSLLDNCKPVVIYMKGWKSSLKGIKKFEDLPIEAQEYVLFIEKEINCKIKYVSIGAERNDIIIR